MDKGLTILQCTKMGADSSAENTPNASKHSAQKVEIFEKKTLAGCP